MIFRFSRRTVIAMALLAGNIGFAGDLEFEEIVVTAQKREQNLSEVPTPITVLTANQLDGAGVFDMVDASVLAPVLEVQSNIGVATTSFRIRRVGTLGNIPTLESPVGIFVDGAFRQSSAFAATELFDIERVEILRGPQSVVYGKNTSAGVISIVTRPPSYEPQWRAEITAGQLNGAVDNSLINLRAMVSGPIGESLRGSLAVNHLRAGEWMDLAVAGSEDANNKDRLALRGQLAWDLSDQLAARLIIGAIDQKPVKQSTSDLYFDPNGFLAKEVLPLWQSVGVSKACTNDEPRDRVSCQRNAVRSAFNSTEATLLADYLLERGVVLSSLTSMDHMKFEIYANDIAQMVAPLLRGEDVWDTSAFQQEFRLNSSNEAAKVDWQLGAFYFNQSFARGDHGRKASFSWDTMSDHPAVSWFNQALLGAPIPVPMATQGQQGFLDSETRSKYVALYGQATWKVSDYFFLIGGLRQQEEQKKGYFRQKVNDPSPSILSLLLSPPLVGDDRFARKSDELTWSLTGQWFASGNTMLFGTLAHGWKSGGFNNGSGAASIADREFQDEDTMHFEAGMKSALFKGQSSFAATMFQTDYADYQDAAFVGGQFAVGNAAKAEVKGFELESSTHLNDQFSIDASFSFADFIYVENYNGFCYPGRTPDSPTDPLACDLSGDHPINAPKRKSHVALNYRRPTAWGEFSTRVDWSWTSEYQTSFSADPDLIQPAYNWINLRAGIKWRNFETVLWINNFTNETVSTLDAVVNIYALPVDGSFQSFLQPPRSFGVVFKYWGSTPIHPAGKQSPDAVHR